MSDPRDELRTGTRVRVSFGAPESWSWDKTATVVNVTMHHEDGWVVRVRYDDDPADWWVRLDCVQVAS